MSDTTAASILIVDDEEVNRSVLQRRLARHDFLVTLAENGQQALDLIGERPFELVLLDIMMPGLDGLEVLERIRRLHPPTELKVIMTTALSDNDKVVAALELGADDYLTKPFDFAVALARIKSHINTLRLGRSAVARASSAVNRPPVDAVDRSPTEFGGVEIGGKYVLERVLGRGGFGVVYQATHRRLERKFAIKLLINGARGSEKHILRFQREAVASCRLNHPNAVNVVDADVTTDGIRYIVMELLEGRTLADELEAFGPLAPKRTAEIFLPLCDLIAEAHDAKMLHRDLKPSNVFLQTTRHGEQVKVLDFGIAKVLDQSEEVETALTEQGDLVCTPAYTAPERLRNEAYDGKSDVYSLGVMLYQILTGKLPFQSESPRGLASLTFQHVFVAPKPPRDLRPELSEAVEEVILWALTKAPEGRPDARALAHALADAAGVKQQLERYPSLMQYEPGPRVVDHGAPSSDDLMTR